MVESPYRSLSFPEPPPDRPYVFLNMIATLDGKTVSGTRDECAIGLGSDVDKATMRVVEGAADAVMAGASTVRTAHPYWRPRIRRRIVVSGSGRLDFGGEFFTAGEPYVACPAAAAPAASASVELLRFGEAAVDLPALLADLRQRLGVLRLLVVGGSRLNGELFRLGLVDELFLTVAPRIKLGEDLPTIAGGPPLSREAMLRFELLECHPVGSELFLRYRRAVRP